MKNDHVLSKRRGREGSKKGKFPRMAQKLQQAHINRLLHTLAEAQIELNVQNKEVTELELMDKAQADNLEEAKKPR